MPTIALGSANGGFVPNPATAIVFGCYTSENVFDSDDVRGERGTRDRLAESFVDP
jgi:hypothetical protein